jgi:uncharacterized protein (TIGR03083 family)
VTAIPERNVDCGEVYERERAKLIELMQSLGAQELAVTVPATPEWSVRDVLAHLGGITADLNALDFGTGDPDAWTAAQVSARRDTSIADVAREWDREAPQFEDGLRLLGYEIGSHYVGDLLQHVGDVRHALGLPPVPDDEPLAVALDFYLISFDETLRSEDLGAVEVSVGPEGWTLGAGPRVASVTADRYELFRCLGGRRTEAQIRAMSWNGDVDAIVPHVSRYPLPVEPIEAF